MRVGDRVCVVAGWSSFHGQRGEVTRCSDDNGQVNVWARLDDDPRPMRFGAKELEVTGTSLEESLFVGRLKLRPKDKTLRRRLEALEARNGDEEEG